MKVLTLILCSVGMCLLQQVNVAFSAFLRLYDGDLQTFTVAELSNGTELLKANNFNPFMKSCFYAFGFTQNPAGDDSETVLQALLNLGTCNVFQLDWAEEASSPTLILDPIAYLAHAVPNAIKIGKLLGQVLVNMTQVPQKPLNLKRVHLIGHSLGAQLMGYSGQEVQKSNMNISRITALDPAGPAFDGPISLDGIKPSVALFVDVIHTNPGVLGSAEEIGQVDIWCNCHDKTQPSCTNVTDPLTRESCDHSQSWRYFSESLEHPKLFTALRSGSCRQWYNRTSTNVNDKTIYMGVLTNRKARGNYYLSTNPTEPYGRGRAGLLPVKN